MKTRLHFKKSLLWSYLLFVFLAVACTPKPPLEAPETPSAEMIEPAVPPMEEPPEPETPELPFRSLYEAKAQKYALLVGIGDYPGEEDDLGEIPTKDVDRVHEVLLSRLGFEDKNILILKDSLATRDNIIGAFLNHLGQARENDVVLFYYSGHGIQLDTNLVVQDYEPDGFDEGLAVWMDGADPNNIEDAAPILDDELGFLSSTLNTMNTIFIMDSCHSGTVTRNGEFQARNFNFGTIKKNFHAKKFEAQVRSYLPSSFSISKTDDGEDLILDQPGNHLLLAAAAPEQSSWQSGLIGSGVFTFYLLNYLEEMPEDATFADLIEKVSVSTTAYTLLFLDEQQHPQLEGIRKNELLKQFFILENK